MSKPTVQTGYSTAITRIPLTASGIYTLVKGKAVLTTGRVSLNVVNGRLNSITVTQAGRKVRRVEGTDLRTVALSFPTRTDTLTLEAFTR